MKKQILLTVIGISTSLAAFAGPEDDFATAQAKRSVPTKTIRKAIVSAGVNPSNMKLGSAYKVSSIYGDPQGIVYYVSNDSHACEVYVPATGKATARCLAR